MNKLKVVVYAIAKDESKYVNKWVSSMSEADEIIVLDTGSTDDTVELLKKQNVKVYESKISPWRFDVARNKSLSYVANDADICVCTDLDEVFVSGWRKTLEENWEPGITTRVRYNYNWKLDEENNPLVSFWINKIHARDNYTWTHPVHEVLECSKEEREKYVPITLNHYPDKNKSRSSYLPLLELSVMESPEDDRNLHYLGREYMFYNRWFDAIKTFHRHIHCPSATWKDERCASMRFMGRCYDALGLSEEAEYWFLQSIKEAPYLREGYVELASFYILKDNYESAYSLLKKALKIKEKSKSYINEEFAWNDAFYDLLSLAAYYTNHKKESLTYVKKAIKLNPKNTRYQENLSIIKQNL